MKLTQHALGTVLGPDLWRPFGLPVRAASSATHKLMPLGFPGSASCTDSGERAVLGPCMSCFSGQVRMVSSCLYPRLPYC